MSQLKMSAVWLQVDIYIPVPKFNVHDKGNGLYLEDSDTVLMCAHLRSMQFYLTYTTFTEVINV